MKYYCCRGRNQAARQQPDKGDLFDTVQNVADVTPPLPVFPVNITWIQEEAQLFQALRTEVFPNRTNFT